MRQFLAYIPLLCEFIVIVVSSITGVTYMDHFDFEQRYRDVNECNPMYWHPLHLPHECIEMFEKLILSRLKTLTPHRIVKQRAAQPLFPMYPNSYFYGPLHAIEYKPDTEYPLDKITSSSQYEMLYELLKRDVRDLPSVPFLGVSPYLGVIAIYKQPVSYKSVAMIKKLARVYDNSDLFANIQPEVTDNTHKIDSNQKTKLKARNNT